MERKKLLLVAISVGVFLVIAIGAAILVFPAIGENTTLAQARTAPFRDTAGGAQSASSGAEPPPFQGAPSADTARNGGSGNGTGSAIPPAASSGIQGQPPAAAGAGSGETVSSGAFTSAEATPRSAASGGNRVEITVPVPIAPAVPIAPLKTAPVTAKSPPQAKPAPAKAKPSPAKVKPQPAKPAANAYWVQAGSFSALDSANKAKDTLRERGITAVIENRDMSGKTWFRVRIGPYTTKSEADYWLALIKHIAGFEKSQVWKNES